MIIYHIQCYIQPGGTPGGVEGGRAMVAGPGQCGNLVSNASGTGVTLSGGAPSTLQHLSGLPHSAQVRHKVCCWVYLFL